MSNPTDTNQASEDELKAIIEWYVDRTAVLADQDGRSFNNKHLLKLDMGTAIEDLIRSEELKARIDEVKKARDDYRARVPDVFDRDIQQVKYFQDRNEELIAELSKTLTKLGAEL